MRTKIAAAALALVTSHASGADLVGQYYQPRVEEGRQFAPESLTIIRPDGSYEIHTVHRGLREVALGTYRIAGDSVRYSFGRYANKCSFVKTEGEEQPATATFRRTADALHLRAGSEELTLAVATPEQARRVLAVPPCK